MKVPKKNLHFNRVRTAIFLYDSSDLQCEWLLSLQGPGHLRRQILSVWCAGVWGGSMVRCLQENVKSSGHLHSPLMQTAQVPAGDQLTWPGNGDIKTSVLEWYNTKWTQCSSEFLMLRSRAETIPRVTQIQKNHWGKWCASKNRFVHLLGMHWIFGSRKYMLHHPAVSRCPLSLSLPNEVLLQRNTASPQHDASGSNNTTARIIDPPSFTAYTFGWCYANLPTLWHRHVGDVFEWAILRGRGWVLTFIKNISSVLRL